MMQDDLALVQDFALNNSEEAFRTLVARHVNLVYSAALRQTRNAHLAEEVAQTVFILLARKAASFNSNIIVPGWLCRTARFVSARAMKVQRRREERERMAFMEPTGNEDDTTLDWALIEPHLDAAMSELDRKEHDAVVLRYLQQRDFRSVSGVLGISEGAAKMRVSRGLEKLRKLLLKRGVSLPATVIAAAVATHSVQAAPPALAGTIALGVFEGATLTATTATLIKSTLKYMAWTKAKTITVIGVFALIGAGTATIIKEESKQGPSASKSMGPSYASPDATLAAMVRALEAADQEMFAAACTPEKAAQFRQQNQGKSAQQLEAEARGMAAAFSKFRILKRETNSPTEILMQVQALGPSENAPAGDRAVVMRMRNMGKDWKYDGEQR